MHMAAATALRTAAATCYPCTAAAAAGTRAGAPAPGLRAQEAPHQFFRAPVLSNLCICIGLIWSRPLKRKLECNTQPTKHPAMLEQGAALVAPSTASAAAATPHHTPGIHAPRHMPQGAAAFPAPGVARMTIVLLFPCAHGRSQVFSDTFLDVQCTEADLKLTLLYLHMRMH